MGVEPDNRHVIRIFRRQIRKRHDTDGTFAAEGHDFFRGIFTDDIQSRSSLFHDDPARADAFLDSPVLDIERDRDLCRHRSALGSQHFQQLRAEKIPL